MYNFYLMFSVPILNHQIIITNNYFLDDSCVKLWDLRKLKNFKTLQLDEGYEVIFKHIIRTFSCSFSSFTAVLKIDTYLI